MTAKEIAKEIREQLKDSNLVTLATDYRWYYGGFKSPFTAYIPEGVTRYSKDIEENDLLNELRQLGLNPKLEQGQSWFYYIKKTPELEKEFELENSIAKPIQESELENFISSNLNSVVGPICKHILKHIQRRFFEGIFTCYVVEFSPFDVLIIIREDETSNDIYCSWSFTVSTSELEKYFQELKSSLQHFDFEFEFEESNTEIGPKKYPAKKIIVMFS